jgi:hypothetical protein
MGDKGQRLVRTLLVAAVVLFLTACQSSAPGSLKQASYPGLGALFDRVGDYQVAQQAAAEQFQSVKEQLSPLATAGGNTQGDSAADLSEYDQTVEAAVAVSATIAAVKQAATATFQQWQTEIDVYTDAQLKADNQAKMGATWQSYQGMMQGVRASETKMNAVLAELNNYVTFLRGSPDASALASYRPNRNVIGSDIDALLLKMKSALGRSNEFIEDVQK